MSTKAIESEYLDRIPDVDEVRQRLQRNLREAKFLRRLLKLAEEKDSVQKAQQREGSFSA